MADDKKMVYPCDPSKNRECNKRGCFINGGPCRSTTHAEYCDAGDFISKQALLYALDDIELIEDGDVDINELEDLIKRLPIIEAEPIKHGRWIMKQHLIFHQQLPYCSECDKTGIFKYDYCPHCGAKMDESTMGQVKHGHWVKYGSPLFSEWECSECGERHTGNNLPDKCPHCKAKMDEVEENG
jgi:Zn finger protein HypA/HybF involved in hydrogenase expression